ncbi:hypothetical protein ACHAWO_007521 [Cyclotella atomus]|uniref:Amidase domain-containing protein n=1 Tax=Cyclotella atomus TaxID=382360 RepID=A0ABD3N0V7_9STRA
MDPNDDILSLSAIELSQRLHSRKITAVELLTATLKRIDDVNAKICAIIALRRDRARLSKEAEQADNDLDAAAAVAAAKKPGWLTGIPLCIKDLENAKGLPTALGGCRLVGKQMQASQSTDNIKDSYIFDNKWVFANAQEDDPYVERLRDAGAIIIGKTNTPELGLGCHSYNTIHGTTLNPFNPSLSAGEISGGAAAALASKMVCLSDGSDMFGSLRNPAGWNNLYSLRPTSPLMEEIVDKKTQDVRKTG